MNGTRMRGARTSREIRLKESNTRGKKRESSKGQHQNREKNVATPPVSPYLDTPKFCELYCISESKPGDKFSSIVFNAANKIKDIQQNLPKSLRASKRTSQRRETNKQKTSKPSQHEQNKKPSIPRAVDPSSSLGTINYCEKAALTPACSPKKYHSQPNCEKRSLRKFRYHSQPGEETPPIYRELVSRKKPSQCKRRSKPKCGKFAVRKSFPLSYFSAKLRSSKIFPISKKNPQPFPRADLSVKDFPTVFTEILNKRCVPKTKAKAWNILIQHDLYGEYDTQNCTGANGSDSLWGVSSLVGTYNSTINQCQDSKSSSERSLSASTQISKCGSLIRSVCSTYNGEYKHHTEELEKRGDMEIQSVLLQRDLLNKVNEPESSIWKPTRSPDVTP